MVYRTTSPVTFRDSRFLWERPIEFRCASSLFTTFEFSCSERAAPCHVDFWQKKGRVPNGKVFYEFE